MRARIKKKKNKILNQNSELRASEDIDLKVWQQERDFWIPRISIILTSNSLLFLGYVMIFQYELGLYTCVLALVANVFMGLFLHKYEEKMNSLEKRIMHRLPLEYRDSKLLQKSPAKGVIRKIFRFIGYSAKGRGGYKMVILIFFALWLASLVFSLQKLYPGMISFILSQISYQLNQYFVKINLLYHYVDRMVQEIKIYLDLFVFFYLTGF